jgi:hypothetical protein
MFLVTFYCSKVKPFVWHFGWQQVMLEFEYLLKFLASLFNASAGVFGLNCLGDTSQSFSPLYSMLLLASLD